MGSVSTRHSDFRIIAATNRDLAKEVEKGTFRRDLYFRLNVINIRLSPLRERREDIPALINHFLSRVGGNYSVTAEALEVMLSYEWPGNVRELENCVQHMVAINSGPLLQVADLPSNLQNHLIQKKSQYLMAAVAEPTPRPSDAPARSGIAMPPRPSPSAVPHAAGSVIPLQCAGTPRHPECPRIHQRRPRHRRAPAGDRPHHPLSQAEGIPNRQLTCHHRQYGSTADRRRRNAGETR